MMLCFELKEVSQLIMDILETKWLSVFWKQYLNIVISTLMLKSFDYVDPNLATKISTLEQELTRLEQSRR